MRSKRTQEIGRILKKNFSRLVHAGIPTTGINAEDFSYFLLHSYFPGELGLSDSAGECFEISAVPNPDILFLYEFIEEYFGFGFEEIELEIERRLMRRIRYSNPLADDERTLYSTILKQKMKSEMEYTVRILEDDSLFGRDTDDVIGEIENLFIIHALDESSSLEKIEILLEDHPRKSTLQAAYLSLKKKRRKVFDAHFDSLMLQL